MCIDLYRDTKSNSSKVKNMHSLLNQLPSSQVDVGHVGIGSGVYSYSLSRHVFSSQNPQDQLEFCLLCVNIYDRV